MNAGTRQHTPGPWKVMPCPQHHGKHPFHDSRWISTEDAELEYGDDHRPDQWCLGKGSLICEMRDGPPANARLIASAPDLLNLMTAATRLDELTGENLAVYARTFASLARAAIARATEGGAL